MVIILRDQAVLPLQIAATDRQIDKLVYELYGLTPDEIKIVEQVASETASTPDAAGEPTDEGGAEVVEVSSVLTRNAIQSTEIEGN